MSARPALPRALHGVACALARTLRAIRAGRFDRGAALVVEALDLAIATLPEASPEQLRAFELVERIAVVGLERQQTQADRETKRLQLASVSR